MGRFLPYEPDQAYLVPPSVKDELGEDHLCFFIHRAVEHMDLKSFEQVYGEEGGGAVLSGTDVEGVAVCLRGGDHVGGAAGEGHPGGPGGAVSGGRSAAGQLGVECVSTAARAGTERRLYAGAGDGAADEVGTIGTGGDRLDADSGGGFAQPAGDRRTAAPGAEPAAAEHSPVAEAVR